MAYQIIPTNNTRTIRAAELEGYRPLGTPFTVQVRDTGGYLPTSHWEVWQAFWKPESPRWLRWIRSLPAKLRRKPDPVKPK